MLFLNSHIDPPYKRDCDCQTGRMSIAMRSPYLPRLTAQGVVHEDFIWYQEWQHGMLCMKILAATKTDNIGCCAWGAQATIGWWRGLVKHNQYRLEKVGFYDYQRPSGLCRAPLGTWSTYVLSLGIDSHGQGPRLYWLTGSWDDPTPYWHLKVHSGLSIGQSIISITVHIHHKVTG